VLFGGEDANGAMLGDTWEWDGTAWTERTHPLAPDPRRGHAMARAGDEVLLFGGDLSPAAEPFSGLFSWRWGGTGWTRLGPFCSPPCAEGPERRVDLAMANRGGKLVLFGGVTTGPPFTAVAPAGTAGPQKGPADDTWEWDGERWKPKVVSAAPPSNNGYLPSMAVLDGKAVFVSILAGTWGWDGSRWTSLDQEGSIVLPSGHGIAAVGDRIVLFGGNDFDPAPFGVTWEWDAAKWTKREPSRSPAARSGQAMATLGGKAVLFGGWFHPSETFFDDTWEWDGTTWTQRAPAVKPPPRHGHAMTTLGNKIVLFGGVGTGGPLADTWEWDGTTWSRVSTRTAPPARIDFAMATLAGCPVVFGGKMGDTLLHDTWALANGEWVEVSPLTYPPPRTGHAMVAFGGEVVMAGGTNDRDTWLLTAPAP
jgi:hypothetical protein